MWSCQRPQSILYKQQWSYSIRSALSAHQSTDTAWKGYQTRELHGGSSPESQAQESRRLLRAILRECTYLPDAQARQWVALHTRARFRKSEFKAWKTKDVPWLEERLRGSLKEARQAFALLRRANEGERKCLMKVLFWTYGRAGKRRHELMEPLLPKDDQGKIVETLNQYRGHDTGETLESFIKRSSNKKQQTDPTQAKGTPASGVKTTTLPELTPQLRALLESQVQASPPDLTRPNPRRLSPDIPALNTWQRPMPQKRVKNMQKKHYAHLLDRVLPPLPTEEWERLRDLANGKPKIERPVSRRGTSPGNDPLEMVVRFGKVPEKVFKNIDAHALTPRFMQRLYAQVFSQCPRMDWDGERNRWNVTWGEHALRAMSSNKAQPEMPAATGELEKRPGIEERSSAG